MRIHVDGIPLDLASRLLPFRTKLRYSLLAHIHLHAKMQTKHEDDRGKSSVEGRKMGPLQFRGIIESLESLVEALGRSGSRHEEGVSRWLRRAR